MKLPLSCIVVALATSLLAACGDDQDVDPGTDSGATAAYLTVSHEGQSVKVDLNGVAKTAYKDVQLVKLSDVWTASKLPASYTNLEFEFVSTDGFKPSSKEGCPDLPGTMLDKGYVNPATMDMSWDETLGLRGCYSVNDVAEMNGHQPYAPADAGADDAAGE